MATEYPWSYSLLQSYETCPWRHNLVKVAKVVHEPAGPAMVAGRATHKAMEDGVNGKAIPQAFQHLRPIIDRIRHTPGQKRTEQKWGLTKNLTPCEFFADNVWVRGVLDLSVTRPDHALVLDYKTGKVKSDSDQLKLFAAAGFTLYPFAKYVKTGYVWLDNNKITHETYVREDAPAIWQEFMPRVQRLQRSHEKGQWEPNPSGLCGWCPVGRERCEFWKGYRGENHRG